jgi:hypothetical protein
VTARPCLDCSEPTETASGICTDCMDVRVTGSRAAQGLPPTVEDPKTLARIGRLMRGEAA